LEMGGPYYPAEIFLLKFFRELTFNSYWHRITCEFPFNSLEGVAMIQFHPVEILEVSQDMFDELLEQLRDYYDLKVTSQDGHNLVAGRGVEGTIEYHPDRKALRLQLDSLHDLVTPGYLIGFLYDRLLAGVAADAKA
jgi:hypothetical protein